MATKDIKINPALIVRVLIFGVEYKSTRSVNDACIYMYVSRVSMCPVKYMILHKRLANTSQMRIVQYIGYC